MKLFSWVMMMGLILGTVAPELSLAATSSTNSATTLTTPEKSSVTTSTGVINLNTADVTALEHVKGLGATKAQAIVTYRQQHGNFASVADLSKVPGFGPKMVAKLQSELTV